MRYKNSNEGETAKTRELRRLFEVEVYVETDECDRNDPACPTRKETVVAWNAVDAIRRTGGKAVSQPVPKSWVTWPEYEGGPIFEIADPNEGPNRAAAVDPTVPIPEQEEWNF